MTRRKSDTKAIFDANTHPYAWLAYLPPRPPLSVQNIRPTGESISETQISIITYDRISADAIDSAVEAFREAITRANNLYDDAVKALERQKRKNQSDRSKH